MHSCSQEHAGAVFQGKCRMGLAVVPWGSEGVLRSSSGGQVGGCGQQKYKMKQSLHCFACKMEL